MKIQEATKRETLHIAAGTLAFSAVMNGVFALLGRWDLTVLWGTLLGGGFAVLNFFLLGLTVQKMAGDPNEKKGKLVLQLSYSLRMLATLAVVVLGFFVCSLGLQKGVERITKVMMACLFVILVAL